MNPALFPVMFGGFARPALESLESPELDLFFSATKTLDPRITFTRASSGFFTNENGVVVGKTPATTSSITPSTTAIGSQITVTVASGSVVGWGVGQAISLIVDTDGQDDPDASEHWLLGNIVSSTLTTLTFTVTSRTATAGSATSWTLGYRGPRFTHDPVSLASQGLLMEESRTNLLLRSEEFSTTPWAKTHFGASVPTTTGDSVIAPNGLMTADTISLPAVSGVNSYSFIYQPITLPTGNYTCSIWLRGNSGGETVWIMAQGSGYERTPAVLTTSWQRFTLTFTRTTATMYVLLGIDLRDTQQSAKSAQTIYAWGGQLEAGAFATSYIPTAGASATRAADVATMTGTNFSSWYNQTEGTIVASATAANASTATVLTIDDGSINNRIFIHRESSSSIARGTVTTSGSAVAQMGTPGISTSFSSALAYRQNDFAFSALGSSVVTGTSGNLPTVDRLRIGVAPVSGFAAFGPIARIRYFRRRLPDANLQTLTT